MSQRLDRATSSPARPLVLRHAFAARARRYTPRRPERTDLYKLVVEHLEDFLRTARDEYERGLPRYVEQELRAYLDCGLPSRGFVHAKCGSCGREIIVAFSCKKRGICPSCNARRMWNTGFVVADRVLPDVPVRQWVLSTPFALRLVLAANARSFGALTRIFAEEVLALQHRRASSLALADAQGGLLVFQHRFGGSLNLNTHLHAVAVDGVFVRPKASPTARATFQRLPAPERVELQHLVCRVYRRFIAWLRRHKLLRPANDDDVESSAPVPSAIEACLRGSLGVGNLHTVPDASGESVPATDNDARRFALTTSPHAAEFGGFGVHAGVTVPEGDAAARARLVRYCARAPLSLERLSVTDDGMVVYRIRKPWKREQTYRVMTPLDFLGRLCALVPPPRHPLLRFYGVFAPHFSWRALCIPLTPPRTGSPDARAKEREAGPAPAPVSRTAQRPPAVAPTPSESVLGAEAAVEKQAADEGLPSRNPWRIDWSTLLRRTYDFDVLRCECGGSLKIVALVTDRQTALEILERLGVPTEPPLARARSPDRLLAG